MAPVLTKQEYVERLSPEEREAEVRRAAVENRIPFDRWVPSLLEEPQAQVTGAPTWESPTTERRIMRKGDLVHNLAARGEWYEFPGTGRGLYVFGLSDKDYRQLLKWSLERQTSDPAAHASGAANIDLQRESAICQVILVCRDGETLQSSQVYDHSDRDILASWLGYQVINAICAISDRLSGEDETFGTGVRHFFGRIRNVLRSSSLACATWDGCPDGLTNILMQTESLVSRAITLGKLDAGLQREILSLPGNRG